MKYDENGERIPESNVQYDENGERTSLEGDSAKVEAFRPIIKQMESGGRYDIVHPGTASGKHALGAYGIVPEFWFDSFPELGLNAKDSSSKQKFLKDPKLQDELFTKIALKGIHETEGDPAKFRAWYYGGPKAVKSIEQGKGTNSQTAYDANGNPIQMPSHAADSQKFLSMLNGSQDIDPDALQNIDTRTMAGLSPLRYPNKDANDPANTLYNNPEAQQESVQQAQQQAISNLPIREQMGSGLGAFAYKFPGMGKVAELSGLAPKGSAQNKKQEIEEYNKNRTLAQLEGEVLPDMLTSSLGGVGAIQALKLGRLTPSALKYGTEGAVLGGVSAAQHQLQHLGSNEKLSPKEATAEVLASATLGTLGGKIGDALKTTAPKVLRIAVQPTLSEMRVKNPPNFTAALEEGVVGKSINKTKKLTDKKLADLQSARAIEAKNASEEIIPQIKSEPPYIPKNIPSPKNTINIPGYFPRDPNIIGPVGPPPYRPKLNIEKDAETLAKESSQAAEKDLAIRKANAKARRNPIKQTKQILPKESIPEPKIKKSAFGPNPEDDLKQMSDDELVQHAFDAEKALRVQTKLKGQRGSILNPLFKEKQKALPIPIAPGVKSLNKQTIESIGKSPKKYNEFMPIGYTPIKSEPTLKEITSKSWRNIVKTINGGTSNGYLSDLANLNKFKGQKGAITNPFYKNKSKLNNLAPKPPMQESRKIDFINKPLANVTKDLDNEILDPVKNKMSSSTQSEAKEALSYWENEWNKRPTVKGKADAKGTVEDALSFRQAIDREINYRRQTEKLTDGFQKTSLALRKELSNHIKDEAPKVGELTEKEGKLLPFKQALDKRVEKNSNILTIPTGVKGTLSALGGTIGAATSEKGKRSEGALTGVASGLSLAALLSTPGGAKLLYRMGKSMSSNTNLKKNTLSQLVRSTSVKSRDKK